VQISHSGTLAGILFDARPVLVDGDFALEVRAAARSLGLRPLRLFTTAD
jgi:hypothetical protein